MDEVDEVSNFYWFVKPEEIYSEEVETEKGTRSVNFIDLDISSGRLRHKWFPKWKASAIRYLKNHEDAEGLRAASKSYYVVNIILEEPVKDMSEKYPNSIPEGHYNSGAIIKIPIKAKIQEGNRFDDLPQKFSFSRNDLIDTIDPIEISSVDFGLMSPEEIKDLAEIEVTSVEVLRDDMTKEGIFPVVNGPMDSRMGAIVKEIACPVCHLGLETDTKDSSTTCQGHFGYIDLPVPIPNILFLGSDKGKAKNTFPIMYTLNYCCQHCSRIMLPEEVLNAKLPEVMQEFEFGGKNMASRRRIRNIMEKSFNDYFKHNGRICPHCEKDTPKAGFRYTSANVFYLENTRSDGVKLLDFGTVRAIFDSIPDTDCYFLGMNPVTSRPEYMFFDYLPVIPNSARPLRIRKNGKTDYDDLTKLYSDVVMASEKVREITEGQQARQRLDYNVRMLFYSVSRVIDNTNNDIGSGGSSIVYGYEGASSLASYKGVLNRLTGKKGRMRSNLQSKYVDSVAYSAVSPDPYLAIDEVGIPMSVCTSVTYPELVTSENIDSMKQYLQNVIDDVYPKAVKIERNGDIHSTRMGGLMNCSTPDNALNWLDNLEPGMILVRNLIKGDICLFNRAPSLHRQSIMAFRVRPVPTKTIRMNPTVCIPFNADYDGDAMKIHIVQTPEARDEAERLMLLTKNIIHARYGKLTVATDQDQTTGLYLFTYTDKLRRNEWDGKGFGFTDEGIPYFSKNKAASVYSTVYSEIRNKEGENTYRTIDSLPEPDYLGRYYTGRALFSHLFTVLDAEYVSATFPGNTPLTEELEDGTVIVERDENGKAEKEEILVLNGKLIKGTLEKDSFGEGGASLAPSFIYHEGYEKGQEKLVEFIELVTRFGLAAHRVIGYTMGVSDVSASPVKNKGDMLYNEYANKIKDVDLAFSRGLLKEYVRRYTPNREILATSDPLSYIEERVKELADEYEEKLLLPIEDFQGSGNPMQISVRSRARGKNQNILQMAGSYGLVRVGPNRITGGINSDRVLPHYPNNTYPDEIRLHPKYRGFIRSNYSKGMEPDEYWLTSSAGRRSTVESSQGNIAKSGYLERKMIKALESCVVNHRKQVVNLRTGRIISPLVGDDGLAPYHIRGSDELVNKHGYTITLQPLLFDFQCKHDIYLALECPHCMKGSDMEAFIIEVDKEAEFKVSNSTRDEIIKVLIVREMTKPNVKKLARKLRDYHQDSICRTGEAIGATAGACIGEPATQAALRTFHFAGKMTVQGSIDRLKQILESPITTDENNHAPNTILRMREGVGEQEADAIKALISEVKGSQIIEKISYDVTNGLLSVKFDFQAMGLYRISPAVAFKQIQTVLNTGSTKELFSFEILQQRIDENEPLVVKLSGTSSAIFLYAKELIMNTNFNGIGSVINVELKSPEEDEKYGRYHLVILSASKKLLNAVTDNFANLIDLDLLETNNHQWIYDKFGLEATLANIYHELDYQMNLTDGNIGEYDMRYIRTIVDVMGEYGYIKSLSPHGLSAVDNPSVLAAISIERIKDAIIGGSTLGNIDLIQGVTESIVVGAKPKIGDYVPS